MTGIMILALALGPAALLHMVIHQRYPWPGFFIFSMHAALSVPSERASFCKKVAFKLPAQELCLLRIASQR